MTIESTDELTTVNGVQCRKWIGRTAGGVPCLVFIPRIAVENQHTGAFDLERRGQLAWTGVGDSADGPASTTRGL